MVETSEISIHELRIFRTLETAGGKWLSSKAVAEQSRVSPRTARGHLLKFVQLNIAEQAEVFPGHRYRLATLASKRNPGYMLRLERAAEVFGEG